MSAAHSLRFMVGKDGESSLTGVAGVLASVEASLALLGLAWAWLRSIRLPYGLDTAAIALGLGAASLLAVLNLALYRLARRTGRPRTVLDFLEGEVFPVFRPFKFLSLRLSYCLWICLIICFALVLFGIRFNDGKTRVRIHWCSSGLRRVTHYHLSGDRCRAISATGSGRCRTTIFCDCRSTSI